VQVFTWTTAISYVGTVGSGVYPWGGMLEMAGFASSYIVTTNAAVARGADVYTLPFPYLPQEMSVYAKFVELGTGLLSLARLFGIEGGTGFFIVYGTITGYVVSHFNGVAAAGDRNGALASVLGNVTEFDAHLFSDGSTDITEAVNSVAAATSSQSSGVGLAASWGGASLGLGSSPGGTNHGFAAIQSFKIVARARTLSDMRTIARLPLGTAPIFPTVTIVGASNNPVITLYNSAGVAVASIGLTIATIAGDTLVIDMGQKTIKKNGVSQMAALTTGDFFAIDPADQANFGGAGPSINSSSGAITVSYRRSWR
jgi:hypothetical protein